MQTKNTSQKHLLAHKFKGRGTDKNPANRFDKIEYVPEQDENIEEIKRPQTQYFKDTSKTIMSFNRSPDRFLSASFNVYKGCEHGCIYCYARPSHEYLSLSAGLDFETKIFVKHEAPKLLRNTLASKKWKPQTIMMSGNTDCYQPIEKKLMLTRFRRYFTKGDNNQSKSNYHQGKTYLSSSYQIIKLKVLRHKSRGLSAKVVKKLFLPLLRFLFLYVHLA